MDSRIDFSSFCNSNHHDIGSISDVRLYELPTLHRNSCVLQASGLAWEQGIKMWEQGTKVLLRGWKPYCS